MSEDCRRRFPRRTVASVAAWFVDAQPYRQGIVCDVSAEGAFLRPTGRLPETVDVGTEIRLVFLVTNEEGKETRVDVRGKIRWLGRNGSHGCAGLGVQFDELQPGLLPEQENEPAELLKTALSYRATGRLASRAA